MTTKIRNVVVVGAGLMGSGIAQVCAIYGYNTTLVDVSETILAKSLMEISNRIKGKEDENILSRIKTSTNLELVVSTADLIIEAIVENMKMKQELYKKIEKASPSTSIIATNTSSLKLIDLSQNLQRKENFGGLHFFIPVPKMRLLEVISSEYTSKETVNTLMEFGESIKKLTVHCKDSPGFIANRILIPLLSETMGLLDRGIATIEDIDLACREGLGLPIGPFALMDLIGLDTAYNVMKGWTEHYPDEIPLKISPILKKLVSEGKTGRKANEGFYKYKSKI